MNEDQQIWYIIQNEEGYCQIIALKIGEIPDTKNYWGSFSSREEAISRRVGLIRAGKCKPQ